MGKLPGLLTSAETMKALEINRYYLQKYAEFGILRPRVLGTHTYRFAEREVRALLRRRAMRASTAEQSANTS